MSLRAIFSYHPDIVHVLQLNLDSNSDSSNNNNSTEDENNNKVNFYRIMFRNGFQIHLFWGR